MNSDKLPKFKILIVDDNPNNIQLLGNILKEQKYEVGYAFDGNKALQQLKGPIKYDLVLLDIEMPIMDGFAACRAMREDADLKEIPVIFLTANVDPDKIVAGLDVGGNDYVTKPFNMRELLARVSTQLKLKARTDQVNQMLQLLKQKDFNTTSSLHYASRIQYALLPSKQLLTEVLPEHFIFYKPRDIVSGDFYWFKMSENLLYFSIADCTGHGVPGAFMSILGLSMLNEIAKERTITPGLMLAKLKKMIADSLWHQNPESITNDGIDLAIFLYDSRTKIIQYAGASRPLNIIRKNALSGEFDFIEIRADQMPLGTLHKDDKTFTNNTLQLQANDMIYLYSDGYASQFGGSKNRKFSSRKFKELLMEIHDKPVQLQESLVDTTFSEWMGDYMQTDDVLVFGFRIE